jgi:hypothetical protein
MCTVLVCALPPNAARREYAARLIARILEKQGDDPVRRDVVRREIADGGAVVGVSPQVL